MAKEPFTFWKKAKRLSTWENSSKGLLVEKVKEFGKMVAMVKENFVEDKCMARGCSSSKVEKCMKEISNTIRWKEKEEWKCLKNGNTREISPMKNEMAKGR